MADGQDGLYFCDWSHVWRPAPCHHGRCATLSYRPPIEGMEIGTPRPISQGEGVPRERPPRFRRIRYTLNTVRRRQS